jgi:hypothetical protein
MTAGQGRKMISGNIQYVCLQLPKEVFYPYSAPKMIVSLPSMIIDVLHKIK